MNDLSTEQLRELLRIREQIEQLQKKEQRIIGGKKLKPKKKMSEAARRKLSKIGKERWKKRKAEGKNKL